MGNGHGYASSSPTKTLPSPAPKTCVATDAQGNVYVANTGDNSIVRLSSTGQLLATWGTARTSPIQFHGPKGVALDAHGNIYVADTGNNRVVKLSPTGMPLTRWGTK